MHVDCRAEQVSEILHHTFECVPHHIPERHPTNMRRRMRRRAKKNWEKTNQKEIYGKISTNRGFYKSGSILLSVSLADIRTVLFPLPRRSIDPPTPPTILEMWCSSSLLFFLSSLQTRLCRVDGWRHSVGRWGIIIPPSCVSVPLSHVCRGVQCNGSSHDADDHEVIAVTTRARDGGGWTWEDAERNDIKLAPSSVPFRVVDWKSFGEFFEVGT